MSTIDVANLTDAESTTTNSANSSDVFNNTTTVDTKYITNGCAKAWVNFNGTGSVAIRDSMNVSSLGDTATGEYTVDFSNNMATSTYAINNFVAGGDDRRNAGSLRGTNTTSLWSVTVRSTAPADNNARVDEQSITGLIHGTLA